MLTPIDIQNHVLKSTMGGYNKKETDDFIEAVQSSYEQLYKENHDLKEKISTLSEGLQYYKQMETTLQKALVLAEKTSTETLEAATTKATAIEKEAQEKADAVLSEAKETAENLLTQTQTSTTAMLTEAEQKLQETSVNVRKLMQGYETYREQFLTLVENQLGLLKSTEYQISAPDLENLLKKQEDAVKERQEEAISHLDEIVPEAEELAQDIEIPTSSVPPITAATPVPAAAEAAAVEETSAAPTAVPQEQPVLKQSEPAPQDVMQTSEPAAAPQPATEPVFTSAKSTTDSLQSTPQQPFTATEPAKETVSQEPDPVSYFTSRNSGIPGAAQHMAAVKETIASSEGAKEESLDSLANAADEALSAMQKEEEPAPAPQESYTISGASSMQEDSYSLGSDTVPSGEDTPFKFYDAN